MMTRFDFRAASSYAAALVVAVWSSTMMFAATAVPAVSAISGSAV